jgi:hypothetical protein
MLFYGTLGGPLGAGMCGNSHLSVEFLVWNSPVGGRGRANYLHSVQRPEAPPEFLDWRFIECSYASGVDKLHRG